MTVLRIGVAQVNPTVGDLAGNLALLTETYAAAAGAGCDLVAFPELVITGYPPEDLVLKPRFVADNRATLERFAAETSATVAVVGFVDRVDDRLYNAAAVCVEGAVAAVYRKRLLPNYSVFDEERYFEPGTEPHCLFGVAGVPVAVSICEDIWSPTGPVIDQGRGGARLNVNINASPFESGKSAVRAAMVADRARAARCAVLYVNQVGGQDELVFDGNSMVVAADGTLLARAPQFVEHLMVVDVPVEVTGTDGAPTLPVQVLTTSPVRGAATDETGSVSVAPTMAEPLDIDHEMYEALVLGTRDYCRKNGFGDVVIGLSGGIDSTLVACVAVDALGADHVHGVSMPSRYSSEHSRTDAEALARNLGIDYRTISIEPAFQAYLDMLEPSFAERSPTLTYENLQSRCRGQVLMALSNEFGWMVLTTGNKSELAVGYFTIYGDSVGGFAVINDVLKTRVYDLCEFVNRRAGREIIPEAVLTKPPSAELRPDQRDDQSLPPYEVLDPILALYVEQDRTAAEIVEAGHDPDLVARVTRLVDIAEYKRRQCPPGVRVSPKAFGKDRRMPITSGYRG